MLRASGLWAAPAPAREGWSGGRVDFHLERLGQFVVGRGFFDELADAQIHGPVNVVGVGRAAGDDRLLAGDMAQDLVTSAKGREDF